MVNLCLVCKGKNGFKLASWFNFHTQLAKSAKELGNLRIKVWKQPIIVTRYVSESYQLKKEPYLVKYAVLLQQLKA